MSAVVLFLVVLLVLCEAKQSADAQQEHVFAVKPSKKERAREIEAKKGAERPSEVEEKVHDVGIKKLRDMPEAEEAPVIPKVTLPKRRQNYVNLNKPMHEVVRHNAKVEEKEKEAEAAAEAKLEAEKEAFAKKEAEKAAFDRHFRTMKDGKLVDAEGHEDHRSHHHASGAPKHEDNKKGAHNYHPSAKISKMTDDQKAEEHKRSAEHEAKKAAEKAAKKAAEKAAEKAKAEAKAAKRAVVNEAAPTHVNMMCHAITEDNVYPGSGILAMKNIDPNFQWHFACGKGQVDGFTDKAKPMRCSTNDEYTYGSAKLYRDCELV